MFRNYRSRDYKEHIKQLIARCIERDMDAWDMFIKLIRPLLSHVIEERFKGHGFHYQRNDIEALNQDILLSIWEKDKLSTIINRDYALSWLCAIAGRAASNYIRDTRRSTMPMVPSLDSILKSRNPSPQKELLNRELGSQIERAMRSLNTKENLVIRLSLIYKKTYGEISEILNMPLGTVLVYGARARHKLKKRLKKYVIK